MIRFTDVTKLYPSQKRAALERVSLDEPSGSIPSMADVFQRKIGRSLFDYLAQFA